MQLKIRTSIYSRENFKCDGDIIWSYGNNLFAYAFIITHNLEIEAPINIIGNS